MTMTKHSQTHRIPSLAALTVLAAAALSACGAGTGGDALPDVNVTPAPDAHYLGALDVTTNLAAEELDARYERFMGDTTLSQASAAITAYYHNAPVTDCVEERGQETAWEEAIQPVDEFTVFAHHDELAPPTTAQANLAQTNAQAEVLTEQLDQLPPKAVDEAIIECLTLISDYRPALLQGIGGEEDLNAFLEPAIRTELADLWAEERERVLEDIGLTEQDVTSCLADQDLPPEFDALDEDATLADYNSVVSEAIEVVPTVPARGQSENHRWRKAVKTEEALALAAWDCKAPAYAKAAKGLTRAMDHFEAAHADKIREAMAANTAILEAARRLGWSPDRPIGEYGVQEARP